MGMVGPVRIGLTTYRLSSDCSTTELRSCVFLENSPRSVFVEVTRDVDLFSVSTNNITVAINLWYFTLLVRAVDVLVCVRASTVVSNCSLHYVVRDELNLAHAVLTDSLESSNGLVADKCWCHVGKELAV